MTSDAIDQALETERLLLVPLRPRAVRALLERDWAAASDEQGVTIGADVGTTLDPYFLSVQLDRMTRNPAGRDWCARLMVRRSDGSIIGNCGFHGPPDDVGRAEIGYTVHEPHRRHGYATEAASALLAFATSRGVQPVYATVSPGNAASRRVLERLGFEQIGSELDERDGEELLLEWRADR